MGEPLWHKEHVFTLAVELTGVNFTEGGRAFAQVDHNIKHATADNSGEFGLCVGGSLKMKSTKYALFRVRHVFLRKFHVDTCFFQYALLEELEEPPPVVAINFGNNLNKAVNASLLNLHL